MSSYYPPYSRSPPPAVGRERSGTTSPFSHYLNSPGAVHEEAYIHYHQPAHFHTSAFSHHSSSATSPVHVRTIQQSASSGQLLPTHSPTADQYSTAQYPYTRHQSTHQGSPSQWASPGSNAYLSPKYPSPYGQQQTTFQFPIKHEEHKYAYSQATSPQARSPQARSPDQRSSPVPFSNRKPYPSPHNPSNEGYASPTHEKNPFSILDHHREYGQAHQARPKPTMADAVAQALNAHPHAVSGYLVMNNFNQKRAESSASHYSSQQPSAVGSDGKLFAFSRPPAGSALAAVTKSSLALARVLTRAQNVTHHHRSAPSGEFIRQSSNPSVNTGGGAFYRSAQEFGKTSFQQLLQRNDTLRAAGASSVTTYPNIYPLSTGASPRTDFESQPIDALSSAGSRTASPTHISMPVLHFPPTQSISHITAKPRAAYPNMSPRLVALSNPGERSARRAALEAENLETERRRAERKRQAEEDAARVAHEVQLRRAERLRQEQLEDARIEAERQERRRKEDAQLAAIEADLAFKRGIAEGMETARRKALEQEERDRRERELRDEEYRRATQHHIAPLTIPTPIHDSQPMISPNSHQLEEARRQRRLAEEQAALESEAAMKRAREERRRKIEEEDRLAEEEAARRREERRKKAEEDAMADEKRRNEKLPSYAQPTKASQAATADTHSTAAQAREERKKKLAAEAAAAEEEAQKARAERRRKQEEAFAAEEAELERKRAARLAQAAEEENTLKQRMEAAKELKEKLRLEEERAAQQKAERAKEKDEREKKAAAEEAEEQEKSTAVVVAVKDEEPPSQETSPAKKSITVDSVSGAGSSSPSSTSHNVSASLDAVRSDMKAIKSFLSLPTTTLLPRLQTTGQIADLNEKELSVLVECGRKDPSDPVCHSLAYLEQLQNNPGSSLTYLNVVELCKELLELRKNCTPCFGIEFQDRAIILKSHAGRAYASWIGAADRDKLFEYLASPECTLFATNVKLSNKTLDSLLTEGGSVDITIERCKDFCARNLQFQSGQELMEALRAIRVWKAGNMNGAALISPAVMTSYAPSARGDPSSIAPLQVLLADSSTIPSSNRSIGPSELLTPKSKTKNQFVAPAWITAQDRDHLFEFLASPESTLFSSNVKLSNRTLNMLLAEGGSAEKTIAICRYFNGQGRQFMTAPALIQAVRQAVAEPPADFVKPSVATADNLIPNPVAPSTLPLPVAPQAPVGSAAPLILPMGVAPPPIKASWITDKERDELFNYLSDPSCMLFSVNVKLSNKTLDAFLTEGGSLIETIAYCKQLNDSGNQYTSTTGLLEAVKLVRIQREKAIADAVTARNVLSARPPMPAVGGLEPISETEGVTERDKKNEPVPSNRANGDALPEVTEEKVSISVIPPTPAKGPVTTAAAPTELDAAALAALAAKLGFTPKTASWITPSDRDRIFDVLAAPECLLFAVNVKLSNKALDSLLVAGGSTDDTIRVCNLLNDQQKQYNTVGELIVGIEEQRALEQNGSSSSAATTSTVVIQPPAFATASSSSSLAAPEDAEAKRIRELEEKQAERKKKRASNRNTADANAIAAATAAAAAGKKESVPSSPAVASPAVSNRMVSAPSQPLTAETITPADRDALFALLANPDTQLFSQDVKLNNKALDRMLLAGTSLDLTTMYCQEFHHSGLQFSTIDDLCAAIEATHDAAAQHKATLFEFLQSHQAHIFTLEAFAKSNGTITYADIDELYLKGQSGLYTFSHVERIHSLNHRAASVEELANKVHEVDQNMNAQHEADTLAVEKYLAQPAALKLFPLAAELSPVDHIHLAASGRQSLYAPSRSVEYMEKLAMRGMSYDTLPDLMTALHHGISNPNTARDINAEPLTARNFLDDENDFDESEMKDLIKVDIAANALAKVNAAKGEARAPSGAIPIPQIPPLPKEAENRRHESALARIAADSKEDEDRIRANKTAKKAQLVAIFKAKDLPKIDTIGSCDGYLEFYRYRAYQDQVTAAVWEQMKNNLWQKVFKTDVVKDTLNPVWPAVIWQVESICSGEYDRPILVKAFGWKRGDNGGEYIGEFVSTLREMLDRSKSQMPFEILNESAARKNPRGYKHSGLLYVQKAEVKIPRSIVAIRTVVSAVQNKVPAEEPRTEGRDRDASAAPIKIMQPSLTKGWGHMAGMGCNQYVYSECLVWFMCKGEKLDKMDTFGESDPFIQVCRLNPAITLKDGVFVKQPAAEDFIKVYETEVIEHTLNPEWRAFALTMKELCTGNILAPLLIKVLDWNKNGSPELIGEFYVDLYTLVTKGPAQDSRYALINPSKQSKSGYKNSGTLNAKVKLLSKYELTSQDPKLVEELVVRAPFLLGWQPGLELKNLQKGKMSKKGGVNRTATSNKATDLKLKMQEQNAQGFASMAGRASKKF